MRIVELEIQDYRIFKGNHVVTFPKGVKPIVFIGVNGAGKTTILEAIIGCLWELYTKIQDRKTVKYNGFKRYNINVFSDEYSRVELSWEKKKFGTLKTGFEIRKTIDPEFKLLGSKEISEYINDLKGEVGFYKNEANIPIILYYPVERTVLNPSLKAKNVQRDNQFDAYQGAFEKIINFDDFFEWFRSTEDIENEKRLNEDQSFSDRGLEAVRKAILVFLEEFTKVRVKRTDLTSLVLEKNEGEELDVNLLSHGEKALISLIGDLTRRLVIANPGRPNPLLGEGIVLIDEIDLHLHPKWQRTILSKLVKTFPNIQFICTTHSPLVINHVEQNSIFLLEAGKCNPLKNKYSGFETYGADVEDILKVVQGVENLLPDDIQVKLKKLFNIIQGGDLTQAKEMIQELKEITDPNQPEIRKAETQIKYKSLIKK